MNLKSVSDNLQWHMHKRNISPQEMAIRMGISMATYYRRIKDPRSLTLGNIKDAAQMMGIKTETLVNDVGK